MSISYHGIVGYGSGKSTLPSVETWGNNMNILRNPTQSIFTRKIDKVGETSEITQMIDNSGDRACEAILTYARGINPMVAVSYDNYGNNGGQKSGSLRSTGLNVNGGSAKQAYLPYRIMNGGAFRPPTKDQRDLLPLSRLPRVWTSSFSQPGFADFSKKAMCPSDIGEDAKGVKSSSSMLKACVRPTATYKIETPVVEPYEVKYVIKNPIQVQGFSGIQPTAKYNGELGSPVKQIVEQPVKPEIIVNQMGEYTQQVETQHFDTNKYTHEVLQGTMHSNKSQDIGVTPIDEIYQVDTQSRTKDFQSIQYTAPQTGYDKYEIIHGDIELDRTLPYHESRTNSGLNVHKRLDNQVAERSYTLNRPQASAVANMGGTMKSIDTISSRNYPLRPTVQPGGFDPTPSVPTTDRENRIQEFDTQKSRMRSNIYQMQQDRNLYIGNIPYLQEVSG